MPEASRRIVVAAALLQLGLALAACTDQPAAGEGAPPAVVEDSAGSGPPQITLTESGAERTGIQTTTVGTLPLTVPYSALLYDANGDTWVYTSPEELTFVRHPVAVDAIEGDRVLLADGPAPGTAIVTTGVAELWGAELGIGQ